MARMLPFTLLLLLAAIATPAGADPPAHTREPWVPTYGPPGGLGYDIRYNFDNPDIWYVTDAFSGFHMSVDDGLNWFPSNEGITTVAGETDDVITVFSATVDPFHPNIIWIGLDGPGRIYKSTDGGANWVDKSVGIDMSQLPLSFRGFTIHPADSNIVFAMAEIASPGWNGGVERKGVEMDMTKGILYRTDNGGELWTEVVEDFNLFRYCWIDPVDHDSIYVSTGIWDREAANSDPDRGVAGGVGILHSTDGGTIWNAIDKDNGLRDLYVGSLYMKPDNPLVMLAAAADNVWSRFVPGDYTGGVFRTVDGGVEWTQVLADEMFTVVEFCENFPDIAYAASAHAVYRSIDAGQSWQRFDSGIDSWGSPGLIAGVPIDMQCDPRDPDRVFVNNYLGGNFLSRNGGQTWISASQGYSGALIQHLAVAPGSRSRIYAASRSAVFRSEDGGGRWLGLAYPPAGTPTKLEEILALVVDPADPDHLLISTGDMDGILYSWDAGRSWQVASFPPLEGNPDCIAMAPSDSSVVYAGVAPNNCRNLPNESPPVACNMEGTGVFISEDGGTTWRQSPDALLDDIAVIALAVDPTNPNVVLASTHSNGLYRSSNRGEHWTQAGAGSVMGLVVTSLAYDPQNPSVVFAGTYMGAIHRSSNGGFDFTALAGGMPANAAVDSIVVDPTNSEIVYAADRLSGVYVSTSGGDGWRALIDGLNHKPARALALSDDGAALYVGIDGAGVYRLGDAPPEPSPHDACSNAVAFMPGTRTEYFPDAVPDGQSSCSALPGMDVWYRHTARANGVLHVNTCGTHDSVGLDRGLDTAISVHSGCPGTATNELSGGCNDVAVAGNDPGACSLLDGGTRADAAVAVPVSVGQTIWIRVEYRGGPVPGELWLTVEEEFPAAAEVPDGAMVTGVPLQVEMIEPGLLELSWGDSCGADDTDYAIYRGTLGDFSGYQPLICSTGGATTWLTAITPDDTYFIVVPHNGANEGGYGYAAIAPPDRSERLPSEAACYPQVIESCP